MRKRRDLLLLVVGFLAVGSIAERANADFVISLTDDGSDLTMTATGSYDFSGLVDSGADALFFVNAVAAPSLNTGVYGWEAGANSSNFPVSFSGRLTGTDSQLGATSVSSSIPFHVDIGASMIRLADGSPLVGTFNESAVFVGQTLSSLGMVAGESVAITWAGDSGTLQTSAVPEPSSTLLLGIGALGIALRRRRSTDRR